MEPQVIAAILSLIVRLTDFAKNSGMQLSDEELAARDVVRKYLVQQALDEGSGDPVD